MPALLQAAPPTECPALEASKFAAIRLQHRDSDCWMTFTSWVKGAELGAPKFNTYHHRL